VPDESRYAIRARLIVHLTNGKTISQTAIRWIDLGAEDPPEGMIGRIVNPDGTAIRVYQGETVRRQQ
jgi:Flp pilus assembly protein CpaB